MISVTALQENKMQFLKYLLIAVEIMIRAWQNMDGKMVADYLEYWGMGKCAKPNICYGLAAASPHSFLACGLCAFIPAMRSSGTFFNFY